MQLTNYNRMLQVRYKHTKKNYFVFHLISCRGSNTKSGLAKMLAQKLKEEKTVSKDFEKVFTQSLHTYLA